jgi:mRNA degradation ribonuclease J1/J2
MRNSERNTSIIADKAMAQQNHRHGRDYAQPDPRRGIYKAAKTRTNGIFLSHPHES